MTSFRAKTDRLLYRVSRKREVVSTILNADTLHVFLNACENLLLESNGNQLFFKKRFIKNQIKFAIGS